MTTAPQKELPFAYAPADPNVAWLETLLQGHGGWMTRRDIELNTGGAVSDRDIRALASASEWIISGQRGYKHIEHASPEETSHAAAWLESQAKQMSDRAGKIRRNAHRRIG
jgi:hypothetical protein